MKKSERTDKKTGESVTNRQAREDERVIRELREAERRQR